jgi:inorganic pyrophosphatase
MNHDFWEFLQQLVDSSEIVIDRHKGSTHPRYPQGKYPVDYGYLRGTTAMDAGGVDIWIGTQGNRQVVGALCTIDLFKKDTELKIIFDCSEEEVQSILDFTNVDQMRAIYIKKEWNYGMGTR